MSKSPRIRRSESEESLPGPLDLSLPQVLALIGFVAICCFAAAYAGLVGVAMLLFLVALLCLLVMVGSVRPWTDDRPAEHIEPMLTRDGGEEIDPQWFE